MQMELFERVRSKRVRYVPQDGDILVLHTKDIPYDFHFKVIRDYIRSSTLYIDGATLMYVYVPYKKGGSVMHTRSAFYSVVVFHFDGMLPCQFEYIGSEPVFNWERSVDVGFSRWAETVEITEYERELYSTDHDIITSDSGGLLAVPFFDTDDDRIDHVPKLKMNGEGYATLRGLLYVAEEWLRDNDII
ncbi:MAG: hypothetical protein KBA55_13655 [Ruminococcus sp.]|nr:hypothetical protein [Ruminococcus sp.]